MEVLTEAIWLTGQPGSGKTTLANLLTEKIASSYNVDGDDLRDLFQNKDYSKEGRYANIRLGMSISGYLISKGLIPIVSLVSPYRELREEFKAKYNVLEVYLHTTEKRGRENYHVSDYEPPLEKYLNIDTTHQTKEQSLDEILNVYR
mgnify:CR=1 FL=1|tara:strand:+ start:128 stop:568 length:441 start_codon:yes stop_codon:yes gene_type:complete